MYNESTKTEFINSITQSESARKNYIALFDSIQPYEERWGDDICTRSIEDIRPIIEQVTGFRANAQYSRVMVLKKYTKWCVERKIPGAIDSMRDFDKLDSVNKLKTHTLSSPAHLQFYLDSILSGVSANTVDNTFRCFYWLAYGGMAERDIVLTKSSDINFQTMSIRYRTTEIPIYREALSAFRFCAESDYFNYEHPNFTNANAIAKPRVSGDLLLRNCRSQPNLLSFRSTLSHISKKALDTGKTNLEMSYYRVWMSGWFYRVYEAEQIGIQPDFRPIALRTMELKTSPEKLHTPEMHTKILRYAREYNTDYIRWKEAYKV